MNKTVLLGIAFVVAVLGFLVYSSMGRAQYRVEACMSFQGRSACRTAAAAKREDAISTAVGNACAQISSGVTDSNQCQTSRPVSIRWISGGESGSR